ncbi:MAG: AAA family ATPase [Campylobacterota bacterium]|nr:AAA family ATPase [Campylobacterota bacterium]
MLLKNIQKNLYELETILSTEKIVSLLKEQNINAMLFLKTINLYTSNFNKLEIFENSMLLEMLDEKLDYFVKNSEDRNKISLYHTKLATSMTFIQDKAEIFLQLNSSIDAVQESIAYTEEEVYNLSSISINNFYSIDKLNVSNITDKKEIYIVGENGDGKTLFLQAIAVALKGCEQDGQGSFRKIKDKFSLNVVDTNGAVYSGKADGASYKNLYAYGSSRNNNCSNKEETLGYLTLFDSSLDLIDPKKWIIKLFNAQQSGASNILALDDAIDLLQKLLNRDIEIDITYDSVTFKERGSVVVFDQLSAGYKSVIIIICDLIEMLSRNQSIESGIANFKGVVLIDEVELHLHPKWKYSFINTLREIFPLIQFIVTTHSPTVILGATKEAVFYKIYKTDGKVEVSQQIENIGYTNNTLISSPLFDLGTMSSRDYDNRQFSGDDYIFEKIHEVVSNRVSDENMVNEEEILKLIDEELSKV